MNLKSITVATAMIVASLTISTSDAESALMFEFDRQSDTQVVIRASGTVTDNDGTYQSLVVEGLNTGSGLSEIPFSSGSISVGDVTATGVLASDGLLSFLIGGSPSFGLGDEASGTATLDLAGRGFVFAAIGTTGDITASIGSVTRFDIGDAVITPLPAAAWLMLSGLAAFGAVRARQHRRKTATA